MDDTTQALLDLLKRMLEDDIFEDAYSIYPQEGSLDIFERRLAEWAAEEFPDATEGR
jgi:hypothetical protein